MLMQHWLDIFLKQYPSAQTQMKISILKQRVKFKLWSSSSNYYSKLHHFAWARFGIAIYSFYQSKSILTLTFKLLLSNSS